MSRAGVSCFLISGHTLARGRVLTPDWLTIGQLGCGRDKMPNMLPTCHLALGQSPKILSHGFGAPQSLAT